MKKRKINKKVIKKKNNFIYDNFKSGLLYIKNSWIFFVIAVLLILLSALVGYFNIISYISPQLSNYINDYVVNSVQEIVKETQNLSAVDLTFFIMSNNIKTAFLGMLSGIFFAVSSVIIVIFNGYVIGFVAQKAVNSPLNPEGIFVLWRLFPHGIFEIPAILISIGVGIKLGLYPFFVKEKGKGFLSLLLAFVIFSILSGVIVFILSLLMGTLISGGDNFTNLLNNPAFSFAFFILVALSYALSIVIGLNILNIPDRRIVKEILANSFRVFVFIVTPLLVIAGLIEGILIALVG